MNPEYYMAKAIQLAKKGWFTTQPNPRVGCVLVKDEQIIGQGYHQQAGKPHAEREAIKDALQHQHSLKGATAYVTLEPCCHQGKTSPCADALIEQQLSKVVIGQQDPNPLVSGKGIKKLENAGIVVEKDLLMAECLQLNLGFNKRMRQGLPQICCKLAMSLDGRTAMQNGESKWISSDEARLDVQKLRAQSGAVVTGIGTILADNPSMNVRLQQFTRQPLRVILDSRLQTPVNAKILTLDGPVIIFCKAGFKTKKSALLNTADIIETPFNKAGELDLNYIFQYLAKHYEINDVLLETGATLAGSVLSNGLIDQLVIYMAAHLMGDQARGLFHLPAIQQMQERISLSFKDVRFVGDTLRLTLGTLPK